KGNGAGASPQAGHLLDVIGIDAIDRKSLCLGLIGKFVSTKHTQGDFAGRNPIDGLLLLATENDIHLRKEPPDKLRTEFGMIKNVAQFTRAKSRLARIKRYSFSFPFRIEQVPIGSEVPGLCHLGVVAYGEARNAPFVDKNVLAFGINIKVLPFPPRRGLDNFRHNQKRGQGIKETILIKAIEGRGASEIDI